MDTRKLSFRLLLVLLSAATILVLGMACDSAPPRLPDGIIHSLEVAPRIPYRETVIVKQTLRNVGNEAVRFRLKDKPDHGFVVETSDGQHVWDWLASREPVDNTAHFPVNFFRDLDPSDEWIYSAEWEQVDNRGEPVPPGTYLVRGYLDTVGFLEEKDIKYWTEALELEVLRPLTSNKEAGEDTRQ